MKWLEEHQIEAIVESMREAHFEGRAGAVSVEIGPEGIRAIADGREIRPAEEALRLAGVARPIDNPQSLLLVFNRRPSDDELRAIHERLR